MNVKRVLGSLNLDQTRTDLADHYHTDGPGRTQINPLATLIVQLVKHLLVELSTRAYSQVKSEVLTRLKINSKIKQGLAELGCADEQIPDWVAEADPEADKLQAASMPAIRVSTARKKQAAQLSSAQISSAQLSLAAQDQTSQNWFTGLQKPQSVFDAANNVLEKGWRF